jgi:hypothetical protein
MKDIVSSLISSDFEIELSSADNLKTYKLPRWLEKNSLADDLRPARSSANSKISIFSDHPKPIDFLLYYLLRNPQAKLSSGSEFFRQGLFKGKSFREETPVDSACR